MSRFASVYEYDRELMLHSIGVDYKENGRGDYTRVYDLDEPGEEEVMNKEIKEWLFEPSSRRNEQ